VTPAETVTTGLIACPVSSCSVLSPATKANAPTAAVVISQLLTTPALRSVSHDDV
jgi:hypothetical protein